MCTAGLSCYLILHLSLHTTTRAFLFTLHNAFELDRQGKKLCGREVWLNAFLFFHLPDSNHWEFISNTLDSSMHSLLHRY
ncbi:hypothetical protein JOL62DRAFT_111101 [Phyllosticta paracitricarpa]|uniref:Secreted protein n=1 Tax=Phyllosticta paracitricarpa TaxID=2016321 RepID=A0ABR1N4Z7_9PEZI